MEYIIGIMCASAIAFLVGCFALVARAVARNIRRPVKRFVQYIHHGALVWVRFDLKGTHRDSCLCFDCQRFHPGTSVNCLKAQAIYKNCVLHSVVTPVYECPTFLQDPNIVS